MAAKPTTERLSPWQPVHVILRDSNRYLPVAFDRVNSQELRRAAAIADLAINTAMKGE